MNNLIKKLKKGGFATVLRFNGEHAVETWQLRFNPVRHKFYLSKDRRGLHRKILTTKQAKRYLMQTIRIKNLNK